MSWLRWWSGTVNDPKWRLIAVRAKCRPGDCVAVWAYLLEIAKEGAGDISAADAEQCAVVLGYEHDEVVAIIAAMRARALIDGDRLSAWERRQPKREDDSRDRVAAHRAKRRGGNASDVDVTQCNAQESESESDTEQSSLRSDCVVSDPGSDASASEAKPGAEAKPKPTPRPRKPYPDDFEAFWRSYPTDPLMSKSEAARQWERLTPEDRLSAAASVPAFRAHCAKDTTYRPVHACRFLSHRRFDGFAPPAQAPPDQPKVIDYDAIYADRARRLGAAQ